MFDAWGVPEVRKVQIQIVLLEGGEAAAGSESKMYVT